MAKRDSTKAKLLAETHKAEIIEQLGASAFDLLTPAEVAKELELKDKSGKPTRRIPELIRLGWLEPVPNKDIGKAHQYYRWRVEFIKRYKRPREKVPA